MIEVAKTIVCALNKRKLNAHFNKQWYDFREISSCPALSLFLLEESLLEHKGHCYKQELNAHIEAYIAANHDESIYHLVSDIKSALLNHDFPFSLSYQGYEINLPDEGARTVSARIKFKIIYFENIK